MMRSSAAVLALLATCSAHASDGLRVMAWNVSNYSGGRTADLQNAMYGVFDSRSAAPDVILLQEMNNQSAINQFASIMNSAAGSPGDWVAAPLITNSGSIHPGIIYRSSKLVLDDTTLVSMGGGSPNHPRNLVRYDVHPVGYDDSSTIALYSVHFKAGSGSGDNSRRLVETTAMRDDAEALPESWSFIVGGDFNTQSSGQSAYQQMVGSQANNDGRFFDPINLPGSWNNSFTFRNVHTQDPAGAGGMDDRHDQILVSGDLIDGEGMDYIGDASIAWNLNTWNDPNHSYRCWGNDGSTYNQSMRVTGNVNVGASIAQSLINVASGGGHLPVFIDMRMPAILGGDINPAMPTIELGNVAIIPGDTVFDVEIANVANTILWGPNGLDDLDFSFAPVSGIGVPGTTLPLVPSSAGTYEFEISSPAPGAFSGQFRILSDDPSATDVLVTVNATLVSADCPADVNDDGVADPADFTAWLTCFNDPMSQPYCDRADVNDSGAIDPSDFTAWLAAFNAGCP